MEAKRGVEIGKRSALNGDNLNLVIWNGENQ